jgi:hypothetical protein
MFGKWSDQEGRNTVKIIGTEEGAMLGTALFPSTLLSTTEPVRHPINPELWSRN